MDHLIEQNIEAISALLRAHRVSKASLFGSAAQNKLTLNSDIDILVTFSDEIEILDYAENYFSLKEKLEELLKREVDLVSSKSLKNPVLIQSINQSKKELYAA